MAYHHRPNTERWGHVVYFGYVKFANFISPQVLIVCHFLKYQIVNPTTGMYTILYIISTSCTMLVMIICAVILKTQSLSSLPLYQTSCALASMTHRFDHTTICISHVRRYRFSTNIELGFQRVNYIHHPRHIPLILGMAPALASCNTRRSPTDARFDPDETQGVQFRDEIIGPVPDPIIPN